MTIQVINNFAKSWLVQYVKITCLTLYSTLIDLKKMEKFTVHFQIFFSVLLIYLF